MDIQKMQVRADLERMVYNYCLMDKIKTSEADQIIAFLDGIIGPIPKPQAAQRGKIIPFPNVEIEKQEPSKSAGKTPWELCKKISEELGLSNIKYLRLKI
jgi:hypothetical protein